MTAPDLPAEDICATTPRPLGRVVMAQRWRDVAFVHWAVEPDRVAPLFPRGTLPDVIDGATWVGLVALRMVDAGLGPRHAVPYLGDFLETNVRLYSVDFSGRRGVVFLSMDASRLAVVLGARVAYGLPYHWSRMHLHRRGDVLTYATCRRWPGPRGATSRFVLRVNRVKAEPSATEAFLTARWGLHHAWAGRTLYTPNEHEPWPLHRAELVELRDSLVAAAGLPGVAARPPDLVHWSPGVSARFGLPLPSPPPRPR